MTMIVLAAAFIVLLALPDTAIAQCSMCSKSLDATGNDDLIRGFLYSVIFMGSVPTIIMAGLGVLIFRSTRLAGVKGPGEPALDDPPSFDGNDAESDSLA
jgi:hypothetical protein